MKKKLTYKSYTGSVEYSQDDGVFFGKLLYISDLILYEADSENKLQASFESAVEEYISDCIRRGRKPEVSCQGTLNVCVDPEIHQQLKFLALRKRVSLNEIVRQACLSVIEADKNQRTFEWATTTAAPWKSDGYCGG